MNLYTSPPPPHTSLDNITKNIYSQVSVVISRGRIVQYPMFIIVQVEALICQHDRAPEFLSQLLDNLTLLGSYPPPPSLPSQNQSLR